MTKLKGAVAYARYSSDRQSARSIDDQLELCRKIAKQNGYEIIQYYKDEASVRLGRSAALAGCRSCATWRQKTDALMP
jgi:DNA invertase Pin-like site-specific DNA recombinase